MKWGDFVIIGAVLALAGAMLAFFALRASGDTLYAEVWQDDRLVERVELTDTTDRTIDLDGHNDAVGGLPGPGLRANRTTYPCRTGRGLPAAPRYSQADGHLDRRHRRHCILRGGSRMKRSKELAVCGMLTALAIILSIVERMFPLDAIIPIPGVKLGLANVVTLFALTRLGLRDSLAVVVVRVTLASLLMGSVTAFLFSLFGGLLALFAMWALLHVEGKFCSLLGVSVAGAAAHNIGQIAAAVLWMKTTAVLAYLPYLLLMSVPLGLVTGLVCAVVLTHMKKIDLHA